MLNRTPRIGKEINAFCGKCKMERTHTIAAMDADGTVRKVTCSMCGGNHNYRQKSAATPKVGRTPGANGRGTRTRSKESAPFSPDPKRPVRAYNMDSSFSTGDVINHPKFGLGSVELTRLPNKIEVRFQEGKKVLLHNMKDFR
jgi:hypothetical protein